jgi:hemolysin activation/secretion protein
MSFQKRLFGLGYSFTSKSSKPIQLETSLYYGNRVISSLTSTQTQFDIAFSKEFRLTKSLDLFLKNTSSKLISNNIGQNELFRVGGPNSIRGFNYQSIFTDAYSLINNELRFLLSNNSKIYSIHDLGIFSINQTNSLLYSIGLGYQIPSKNNLVNISFSKGYSNASFVKNSQVFSVNLLSFF